MRKAKPVFLFCFCSVCALLNFGAGELMYKMGIPLYMDTVFTIACTLAAGLLPGIICGALTNLIIGVVFFAGFQHFLFAICNITTALVTFLIVRFFPRELSLARPDRGRASSIVMDRVIVLILLSFALCAVMSVQGGIIAALINIIFRVPSERQSAAPESAMLAFSMFPSSLSIFPREILSRVPVNIVDRLLSVFSGYGIARAVNAVRSRFGAR